MSIYIDLFVNCYSDKQSGAKQFEQPIELTWQFSGTGLLACIEMSWKLLILKWTFIVAAMWEIFFSFHSLFFKMKQVMHESFSNLVFNHTVLRPQKSSLCFSMNLKWRKWSSICQVNKLYVTLCTTLACLILLQICNSNWKTFQKCLMTTYIRNFGSWWYNIPFLTKCIKLIFCFEQFLRINLKLWHV